MRDYKNSRGWRNNNPLNIKHGDSAWNGMREVQKDSTFVQFVTMPYGYRAAIKILLSYWRYFVQINAQPLTISRIIRRWCPSPGVDDYIKFVEQLSGIKANQPLPDPRLETSVHLYVPILGAMTVQECGCPWKDIPWKKIEGGYYLAFHVRKVKEYAT